MSDYRPCPSCPDGSVWNSDGPTCRTCPTCGGFAVVHLDGSKLTRAEALGIGEPEGKCPHGNPVSECNACYEAADFAYDAAREDAAFGRR